MLIAVAGSQGSGKSTLINKLENLGYKTITRKTSRSILSDWNVTLSQVNNDRDLTVKFQDEILKRKLEDESVALGSSDVWFTERTFADLFTYTCVAIGKDNEYNEWMNGYYERCVDAQKIYKQVVYLQGGLFPIQPDGVRAINPHYSRMVDMFMKQYTKEISQTYNEIDFVDMMQRVRFIEECIQNATK